MLGAGQAATCHVRRKMGTHLGTSQTCPVSACRRSASCKSSALFGLAPMGSTGLPLAAEAIAAGLGSSYLQQPASRCLLPSTTSPSDGDQL